MPEINLLKNYPRAKRNLTQRKRGKDCNRSIAKQFGREYFDGPREQGYGGYQYDGRWRPIARDIAEHFGLAAGDRILDIGCAKGFLMRDIADAVPGCDAWGLEISQYAIEHCHPEARNRIVRGTARQLPFADNSFAAVLCINVIHNLAQDDCIAALREIQRVSGGRAYLQVDAYRSEKEREIFLDWVLTAETFGKPELWLELFKQAGYTGDYFWTILELDPQWTIR